MFMGLETVEAMATGTDKELAERVIALRDSTLYVPDVYINNGSSVGVNVYTKGGGTGSEVPIHADDRISSAIGGEGTTKRANGAGSEVHPTFRRHLRTNLATPHTTTRRGRQERCVHSLCRTRGQCASIMLMSATRVRLASKCRPRFTESRCKGDTP